MATMSHNWQALWEETIEHASYNPRERLDLNAGVKRYGGRLNQSDPKKKAELDAELSRLRRFINKDSSVLDIGAGFGRLAIPLAREVRRMTVIEPSHISINRLKENARQEGADNIEFAEVLWTDFLLHEKYDLVLSTRSPAICDPTTLMKMHEASRSHCALERVASPMNIRTFEGRIYPMIIGREFRQPGNYLNIVTTLYDYGIYANIETWRFDNETNYQTIDEAVEIWKTSLEYYAKVNEETEEKLRQFYRSRMNPDGSYCYPTEGVACMIWWHV